MSNLITSRYTECPVSIWHNFWRV